MLGTQISTRDKQEKIVGSGSAEDQEAAQLLRTHQGQPSISASLQTPQECRTELLVVKQRLGRPHLG